MITIDGIKHIGNWVVVLTRLCNKSWLQIDDSQDRATYVFKANNQLYLTVNGISQIVHWKYFWENERLVIYNKSNEGKSFRYSFIEKGVLLSLKDEQTGAIILLANESSPKAPKSVKDLGLYFIKRNASEVGAAIGGKMSSPGYFERVARTIDRVLDGCDNVMLIDNINYFRTSVPGFSLYYRQYINYKKYLQDNPKEYSGDAFIDAVSTLRDLDKMSTIHTLIPPVYSSKYMDNYIYYTGTQIDYDEKTKRLLEIMGRDERMKE